MHLFESAGCGKRAATDTCFVIILSRIGRGVSGGGGPRERTSKGAGAPGAAALSGVERELLGTCSVADGHVDHAVVHRLRHRRHDRRLLAAPLGGCTHKERHLHRPTAALRRIRPE